MQTIRQLATALFFLATCTITTTAQNCTAPQSNQIFANSITLNSARLSCNDIPGASLYQFQYRKTGTNNWTLGTSSSQTFLYVSGLLSFTSYEFQCRIFCNGSWTAYSSSQSFSTTAGGNSCNNPNELFCSSNYSGSSNTGNYNFTNYPFAGSINMTGPEAVHKLTIVFPALVTINMAPQTQDLDLFLLSACDNTSGLNSSQKNGTEPEQISMNLNPGVYYVIVDGWNGAVSNYNLNILCTQNTACPTPAFSDLNADDLTCSSVQLTCNAGNGYFWAWAYRPLNSGPWISLPKTSIYYTNLIGLNANTTYEFRCAIRCSNNTWSDWSPAKQFTTLSCPPTNSCNNPIVTYCGNTYTGNNSMGNNNFNGYYLNSTVYNPETGPEMVYLITLSTGGPLHISLTGFSGDLDLFLLNGCGSSPNNPVVDFSGNDVNISEFIDISYLPAGTYYIVVDGYGGATSNFSLSVNCNSAPPSGNSCNNPFIASCGNTYSNNNGTGSNNFTGYNLNIGFVSEIGPEIVYKLTLANGGPVNISLTGLSGDLDLFLLNSCSNNAVINYSGNPGSGSESIIMSYLPAGTYLIVVDGWDNTISNYSLSVQCGITGCAPPMASQLFASNLAGITARINSTYQGTTSFQWRYRISNSTNWIGVGPTSVNYANLTNLLPNENYEFQCAVLCNGSWTSWSASQFFNTVLPYHNEPCAAYELATGGCFPVIGSNIAGSTSYNPSPPGGCSTFNMRDVWYKVLMPSTGRVKISTFPGSMTNGLIAIYSGNCNNLFAATNPVCFDNTNGDEMPDVQFTGTPGTWYYIRVWGFDGAVGTFSICAQTTSSLVDDGSEFSADQVGNDRGSDTHTAIEQDTKANPEEASLQLFPVPAEAEIKLSTMLDESSDLNIRITSMTGQVMQEETLSNAPAGAFETSLDISRLPSGTYVLRFQRNGQVSIRKFIKI